MLTELNKINVIYQNLFKFSSHAFLKNLHVKTNKLTFIRQFCQTTIHNS